MICNGAAVQLEAPDGSESALVKQLRKKAEGSAHLAQELGLLRVQVAAEAGGRHLRGGGNAERAG